MFQMVDPFGAVWAHLALLTLVGIFGLLAMWIWRSGRHHVPASLRRSAERVRCAARRLAWPLWGALVCYGIARLPDLGYGLAVVLVLPFLPLLARIRTHRAWTGAASLGVLSYAALALVPGFLAPLTFPHPVDQLSMIGAHYNTVVGFAADRLAQGGRLFTQVEPSYGLLLITFLSSVERHLGLLDLGGHVRAVQVDQVLYALLALIAHYLWAHRRPWKMWLALTLVIAWSSTYSPDIWYPNLSGWRFLGFALASAVLVALRKLPIPAIAAPLGALVCICVLINPNSAVAVATGVLVYALAGLGPDRPSASLAAMARFAAGGAATLAAFAILFRLLLGDWPVTYDVRAIANTVFTHGVTSKYAGLRFSMSPEALWILLHSVYTAVRSAMIWRQRALSPAGRVRAALATMILVWFVYYAKRPDPHTEEQYLFLYSFFVYDLLEPLGRLARMRHVARPLVTSTALLAAVTLLPADVNLQRHMAVALGETLSPPVDAVPLSGVLVPPPWARELNAQSRFVLKTDSRKEAYFTANAYLMFILTGGQMGALNLPDPFVYALTESDFDHMSNSIVQSPHLTRLLFDAPGNITAGPMQQRLFYTRLKSRLNGHFCMAEQDSSWEVWKRSTTGGCASVTASNPPKAHTP